MESQGLVDKPVEVIEFLKALDICFSVAPDGLQLLPQFFDLVFVPCKVVQHMRESSGGGVTNINQHLRVAG